jgi:hypothetical protein
MKDFVNKLIATLDTHSKGFSARKLTAFVIVTCVITAHIKWLSLGELTQLGEVLIIDYSFIAALFGMTTYQNLKNGSSNTNQSAS